MECIKPWWTWMRWIYELVKMFVLFVLFIVEIVIYLIFLFVAIANVIIEFYGAKIAFASWLFWFLLLVCFVGFDWWSFWTTISFWNLHGIRSQCFFCFFHVHLSQFENIFRKRTISNKKTAKVCSTVSNNR